LQAGAEKEKMKAVPQYKVVSWCREKENVTSAPVNPPIPYKKNRNSLFYIDISLMLG
jgi:hypothetical protein